MFVIDSDLVSGARFSLDAEDNNQLWIGRGGNLTPCHYDTWITGLRQDVPMGSLDLFSKQLDTMLFS